ncbi:hypothetical protein LTR91_012084 [Friedmanniomyces endolithicus]|uniref:BTB domain-containing protein n=1 Tax=Friedmanniomyces endolithicus TaxID=329885 RepID=A0AAN6QQP8_9PEZI|nr:hypothetical protein LTR38_005130 [Friedmanniomyces endolithicus]KAK0818620.1 hypothetical protein LTR75_002534 [Friedmanniomyces endolithicus]KAK0842182.1 hypothetical protein LTR03_009448 [Friedmanniomyces endolithicus]KAK0906290.1 hypothetical protein LTR57_017823 [Friedmanniomyces endolithicus]KAK0964445.1 hypothetical protein LTS01_018813 [Friedmanniomyces endolithicus]
MNDPTHVLLPLIGFSRSFRHSYDHTVTAAPSIGQRNDPPEAQQTRPYNGDFAQIITQRSIYISRLSCNGKATVAAGRPRQPFSIPCLGLRHFYTFGPVHSKTSALRLCSDINTLEHTQRIELPALLLNTTQSTDSTPHSSEKQSSKRPAHEKTERPTKQARMSSLTFTQTVEVIVCDTKTKFFIHASIIAARSPFFDAAVTRWKKAGEPITLADDDPEIFDYDLSLLYAGSFQSLRAEVDDDDVDIASLFKLYILADKLGDLTNANGVIDRLYGVLWESVPTLHKVLPAWRSTPPGSPLRRLLVDAFTRQADPEALSKQLEHASIPKDLVVAIAQRAVGIAGLFVKYSGCRGETAEEAFGKFFAVDDECRYHQHDDLHSYCRAREDAMEDE